MNRRLAICLWIVFMAFPASGKDVDFDRFFFDKTMRIDYFHVGNAEEEVVTLDRIYRQGIWAGSVTRLLDAFDNGRYYARVYDAASGELIYSKGFDSYFGEYRTTSAAGEGRKRTYHESVLIPSPKSPVRFVLEVRNRTNDLDPLFGLEIDPRSVNIIEEELDGRTRVIELENNGPPHRKVDVAILAEGYTREEESKLQDDLERFREVLFGHEPFKSRRSDFNLYGVFRPSEESGCDEPRYGAFRNTALGTTFNSLGSERYLLTEDNRSMRDIAAHVPYDALYIMVNHSRYGGGGIYNLFCTFTSDNQWYKYLFLHEFGHSFAGLGDEYYTSSVAYNDFYPRGIEPTEPNLTALLSPDDLKWKDVISAGVEIPTPWEKADFDALDAAYQKVRQKINDRIAELKRTGASAKDIAGAEEESERLSREHADRVDAYLAESRFVGKVGAFEGAGYSAEGLYRPMLDCLMFTKGDKPFCRVCEQAVIRVIDHYTK